MKTYLYKLFEGEYIFTNYEEIILTHTKKLTKSDFEDLVQRIIRRTPGFTDMKEVALMLEIDHGFKRVEVEQAFNYDYIETDTGDLIK